MVSRRPTPRRLALLLGLVTFLAWTVERFLWELADVRVVLGVAVASASRVVLAAVTVATLGLVGWYAFVGRGPRPAATVLAGPLAGVGAFLVLATAVLGPSSDSPTWLVSLALCAGGAAAGGVAYGLGVVVRRLKTRTESA